MVNSARTLTPESFGHFGAEYGLNPSDVDDVITKLRQDGSGGDLVLWLQRRHSELTEEQCVAAIRHIREILYGRLLGLQGLYQPGSPATVLFRMPVAWPSGERTDWELVQLVPRLDLGVTLIEAGEAFARLEVDLSLPFSVGLWHTQRPTVERLTADAANLDGPFEVETVRSRRS